MAKLFVYGTLEDPELMKHLLGYKPMNKRVELKGFKRIESADHKTMFPSLVPAKGESVLGIMYDVNERDLQLLDHWEANYNRVLLKGVYLYLLQPYRQHFHNFIEAKQVGVLYHFTNLGNLYSILTKGILKSKRGYISFTRNFQMPLTTKSGSYLGNSDTRITIDGDKLSNKYKIIPYIDRIEGGLNRLAGEEEEKINKIQIPILPYILQIDILKDTYAWHNLKIEEDRYNFIINHPLVNIVPSWKPVK